MCTSRKDQESVQVNQRNRTRGRETREGVNPKERGGRAIRRSGRMRHSSWASGMC